MMRRNIGRSGKQIMRDLETRIRKAFGLTPAASNFLIVVQAYYDSLSDIEDHDSAYEAALAAYCRSNGASPADNATRTMVGVLIAEAGVQGGRRLRNNRMTG
jgi:hypothetical protein